MSRPFILLILVSALIAGVAYGVLGVVLRPDNPPATELVGPKSERLTDHLLFVVVDGLRYDVATNHQLMPRFAEAMQRNSSAEIWAGRVSMTTSAILSYGTGQRGQLEQVVNNLTPDPPPFNSWLENAKRDGRTLMLVGDPAWERMYGPSFSETRLDPKGVAIDVDFNEQTFRDTRELLAKRPDFLVAHFVTPDHQGHAYGIHSARYQKHIHQFDRQLSDLLGELATEWTVVVTSDHGAADSGTHGADVPVQRRSPLYAYGPGVAKNVHPKLPLDQVDLSNTLAALLGTTPPKQSRGQVLAEWLDIPEAKRASLLCEDAQRIFTYGQAKLGDSAMAEARQSLDRCAAKTSYREREIAARKVTAVVDTQIGLRTGLTSQNALVLVLLSIVASAVVAWFAVGKKLLWSLPPALFLATVATWLVFSVERLPGHWPNISRVVLFVACNSIALFALLKPLRTARRFESMRWLAPSLLPGLLVASYPANTQPESFVAVAVIAVLFCLLGPIGSPGRRSDGWERLRVNRTALEWPRLALVALCVVVLLPLGVRAENSLPAWLVTSERTQLLAAIGGIALYAASTRLDPHGRSAMRIRTLIAGALGIVACLVARRYVPHQVGRAAVILFPVLALVCGLLGHRRFATLLGLAGFAWVSRDREWYGFVPTLILAEAAGDAWRTRMQEARDSEPVGTRHEVRRHAPGYFDLLLAVTFVFGLVFVQRIALTGQLDFGGMDLAAGAFNDPHVPLWVVGAALSWKYILAEVLVVTAFVGRLEASVQRQLLPALVLTYLGRMLVLLLELFFCGGSYWTALRVIGDLPFSLTGLGAVAISWWALEWWRSRRRAQEQTLVPSRA
ncbi:MAG: alkaline phosphatase family protein [Polyangiaceae bacterium]